MPKPNQIYDNDPTCPVSANSFYDEYGNIIDDTHIHDNRYYTKSQTDGLIDTKLSTFEFAELTNGAGINAFMYNGTSNKTISLDFETSSEPIYGFSSKPAKVDHFHKNLTSGYGIKYFLYNGSDEVIINLNFENNGSSNLVSRSDHKHKILSNGVGIKSLYYDGSTSYAVALDYVIGGSTKFGSSDKPARSDHSHELLKTGNGFIYLEYTGEEAGILTIDYEGFNGDFGQKTSIARADHVHDGRYYKISDINSQWVSDITVYNNELQLRNRNNDVMRTLVIPYASVSGKWANSISFTLDGDVRGTGFIDGSGNFTMMTTISGFGGTLNIDAITSIKTYSREAIREIQSSSISFTGIGSTVYADVISSPKLQIARNISLTGAITGTASFDGTQNAQIITTSTTEILENQSIKDKIKDLVSSMFSGTNTGISITYNSTEKTLNFDVSYRYYKDNSNIIPEADVTYTLGSSNKRFSEGHIQKINAEKLTVTGETSLEILNTKEINVSDKVLRLNSNETSAGISGGSAALVISRGTQPDALLSFNESSKCWLIGTSEIQKQIATVESSFSGINLITETNNILNFSMLNFIDVTETSDFSVILMESTFFGPINSGVEVWIKCLSTSTIEIKPQENDVTIDGETDPLTISGNKTIHLVRVGDKKWVTI